MIRGSTPTHIFTLPFDMGDADKVKIIYAQDDNILLTKERNACKIESNVVSVKLSQEETLLFDCKKQVQIQIRVLTAGEDSLVSDIIHVSVAKCLESEVMK